ncbi:MAG: hypothetical protein LQ346_007068 [Caloplaca aetnensis]|nr:MAG: hypothetical protein LQ346_007068 [Caloplaca aetnensis]
MTAFLNQCEAYDQAMQTPYSVFRFPAPIIYHSVAASGAAEDARLAWAVYDLYALRGHLHTRSTSVADATWKEQSGRLVEKMSRVLNELVHMIEVDQQAGAWL